jgi:hypothetical protein
MKVLRLILIPSRFLISFSLFLSLIYDAFKLILGKKLVFSILSGFTM